MTASSRHTKTAMKTILTRSPHKLRQHPQGSTISPQIVVENLLSRKLAGPSIIWRLNSSHLLTTRTQLHSKPIVKLESKFPLLNNQLHQESPVRNSHTSLPIRRKRRQSFARITKTAIASSVRHVPSLTELSNCTKRLMSRPGTKSLSARHTMRRPTSASTAIAASLLI